MATLPMTDPDPTDQIIAQGKALVRAIEALGTIEPSGWFERWQMRLLQAAYKQRLRAIVVAARLGGRADTGRIGANRER